MHAQADHQHAELRQAFLRHLPKRAEAIGRRGRRFCRDGWDINGLSLLHEDVQRLAGVSGRYGVPGISEQLLALEDLLGRFLSAESLPDQAANERIVQMLDELTPSGAAPVPAPEPAETGTAHLDSPRMELAPPHYWRRWSPDAAPAVAMAGPAPVAARVPQVVPGSHAPMDEQATPAFDPAALDMFELDLERALGLDGATATAAADAFDYYPAPEAIPPPPLDDVTESHEESSGGAEESVPGVEQARFGDEPAAAPPAEPGPPHAAASTAAPPVAPAPEPPSAAPAAAAGASSLPHAHPRIYHLTDSSPLAVELDQRMEALGYELELTDNGTELAEILGALSPDAVIVDAGFHAALDAIAAPLRVARERSTARVALLVLSDEDSVPARLAARRAGADALLIRPAGVEDVLGRLQELLEGGAHDEPPRILVVEDDRSQALFAESVLRNAGMEALVVTEPFEALDAMQDFRPDLVLMDLYMPNCDGAELTALIREREEFLDTPIVFLSGESDQDKHYEVLAVGGDDFLSKPIRPKHLIAAVTNRVLRARALRNRKAAPDPRDPATGLYRRGYLLDRLNISLAGDEARQLPGGILFLEVDGVATLRERLGLTAFEQLLGHAGAYLAQQLEDGEIATRFGDGSFVVLCPSRAEAALEARAAVLRGLLIGHAFSVAGQPLRIRVSVGACEFRHGFADAGALLNAAERASRDARGRERGVHRYEPPRRAEDERAQALTLAIGAAIEQESFDLVYQPIVALQGGEEAQYQTLLRLRGENGQMHTAGELVPLATRAGLMPDIDRWVIAHSVRLLEQRRLEQRPVRLFVSQAAATMVRPAHAAWIAQHLQSRHVDGAWLVLELALDDVSAQIETIRDFCAELVPLGVRFCLSRFEAGLEGDSVLEQLPVDYIKLSTRYAAMPDGSGLRDDLRTLVERAHRRGLSVIAQRVEDAQAAARLWMSGIDYIQGNLVQLAQHELEFDFQTAVL